MHVTYRPHASIETFHRKDLHMLPQLNPLSWCAGFVVDRPASGTDHCFRYAGRSEQNRTGCGELAALSRLSALPAG